MLLIVKAQFLQLLSEKSNFNHLRLIPGNYKGRTMTMAGIPTGVTRASAASARVLVQHLTSMQLIQAAAADKTQHKHINSVYTHAHTHTDMSTYPAAAHTMSNFQRDTRFPNFVCLPLIDSWLIFEINYSSLSHRI